MKVLFISNIVMLVIFVLCYLYQIIYMPLFWIRAKKANKLKPKKASKEYNYAILICARNESMVIGDLIDSLNSQTYNHNKIHIFVMADNCNDDTASIALSKGANVYKHNHKDKIGKGYALDYILHNIKKDYPKGFDAYIVFDADNILAPNYIEEMNKTFNEGHDIITSYRNSKNYATNFISSSNGLWFLRESRYLNHARYVMNTSCAVSGTGFLMSQKIVDENKGWPYHSLIEDIEFTLDQVTKNRKIAFCPTAELFDEQPITLKQSWVQRVRWCRGEIQVFAKYVKALLKGTFKGNFSCYDLLMATLPAYFLSVLAVLVNVAISIWGIIALKDIMIVVYSLGGLLISMYVGTYIMGLVTTISEWKKIKASNFHKVIYTFTFPYFLISFIPIIIASLFKNPGWVEVKHSQSVKTLRNSDKTNKI